MTVQESKNGFSRLASTTDMLFEVREIKESGNRMTMSGVKGGIGKESAGDEASTWLTRSQQVGLRGSVEEVRSDPFMFISLE